LRQRYSRRHLDGPPFKGQDSPMGSHEKQTGEWQSSIPRLYFGSVGYS
jgi:hypothetical protein